MYSNFMFTKKNKKTIVYLFEINAEKQQQHIFINIKIIFFIVQTLQVQLQENKVFDKIYTLKCIGSHNELLSCPDGISYRQVVSRQ